MKNIKKIKVENMVSPRGNTVANQFIISTEHGQYFQSYHSIIAYKPYGSGKTILDERYWGYSVTTGKYRNLFLNEDKAETKYKIKSGQYILKDLN